MSTVILALQLIIQILWIAIFGRVILSWFIMNTRSRAILSIYQALHQITEPILAPLRRVVPMMGMVDITPMVAIFLLWIISYVLAEFA